MRLRLMLIVTMVLLLFAVSGTSYATIYFYFDAENGTVGTNLTNPPFCQTECSGSGAKGTIQSSGGAPQGIKYFQWQTVNNQTEHYTEIYGPSFPITNIMGKTFYLAYYFNYTRINGLDIWHEGISVQSADKGVEIDGSGVRWIASPGQWEYMMPNQDHHYTVWMGNPTYHLNSQLEVIDALPMNQSGYSASNTMQLEYERWYSAVMAVKMATDNTGMIQLYIDGVKILEYNNIKTAAYTSSTINGIFMGGTIAQPYYDAPAHLRKFDALMLTDNWQDIVNGGYLRDPEIPPDTTPPTVSITSPISDSTVSGIVAFSADASDDVAVAGVQFNLDGANLDSEDTTSPYTISWDTTTASNGSHTLTATA